jgi:ribosomal protein L10
MGIKSSVAIDTNLRKKLKKLAAILDMTQGEIISQAVEEYEKKVLNIYKEEPDQNIKANTDNSSNDSDKFFAEQLKKASEIIWKKNPAKKKKQEELYNGTETIDDFIILSWDSGLEL